MQIHLLDMHYIKQIYLHMFFEANINVQNVLLIKKKRARSKPRQALYCFHLSKRHKFSKLEKISIIR